MEPDFSGYATRAGVKCSDGRTIMPGAFKHQDQTRVPLVWQHGHKDPENVLGHVMLENRDDGVYAHAFFNDSPKAKHTKGAVQHKDITMMSIWANELVQRGANVLHGAIREVSLVISGANPGALIETITIHHSDGDETLEDEAIIYSGLEIDEIGGVRHSDDEDETEDKTEDKTDDKVLSHADGNEETIGDIYDSLTEKQKKVVHYMLGRVMEDSANVSHDSLDDETNDETNDDVNDETNDDVLNNEKGEKGSEMKHNVFEDKDTEKSDKIHLSHADMEGIIADAMKNGSLKESVEAYALQHGITDIDTLFPDAVALDKIPEFLKRRTEWVNSWLAGCRKSPFSRIKTVWADITMEEARAKGYVTGAMKREEFFTVAKRTTTPTTVYKKQQLDRDDVVDITDFDVVAWLRQEMRVMLDEEIAVAALIGDGRDISDADKINEQNIRPIVSDHELFVTTLYAPHDTNEDSTIQDFIDIVIKNRYKYKGTGVPTMFTKESVIAQFLLLKDTLGRQIYRTLEEVAAVLRVDSIVPVEAMEADDTLLAIFVNPADYVYGASRGGEVSMFDDFDIDYNQYKYLIETRLCGALVRLKSAIVVRSTASTDTAVVPNAPTFVESTGVVTIVATTHVTYKNADTDATLSTGAQTALDVGETLNVRAVPDSGYFVDDDPTYWSFTRL